MRPTIMQTILAATALGLAAPMAGAQVARTGTTGLAPGIGLGTTGTFGGLGGSLGIGTFGGLGQLGVPFGAGIGSPFTTGLPTLYGGNPFATNGINPYDFNGIGITNPLNPFSQYNSIPNAGNVLNYAQGANPFANNGLGIGNEYYMGNPSGGGYVVGGVPYGGVVGSPNGGVTPYGGYAYGGYNAPGYLPPAAAAGYVRGAYNTVIGPNDIPRTNDAILVNKLGTKRVELAWQGQPRAVKQITFSLLNKNMEPLASKTITAEPARATLTRSPKATYYRVTVQYINGTLNRITSAL